MACYIPYSGKRWQENTLANGLFQINTNIKGSVKLREKTLAIGHQFANVFSHQCFLLYGNQNDCYMLCVLRSGAHFIDMDLHIVENALKKFLRN